MRYFFLLSAILFAISCNSDTPPNMIFYARRMELVKPEGYGSDIFSENESIYIWPDRVHYLVNEIDVYGKWEHPIEGVWVLRNDSMKITVTYNKIIQTQTRYLDLIWHGELRKNKGY